MGRLGDDPTTRVLFLGRAATVYTYAGEPATAQAYLEEAVSLAPRVYGPNHPELSWLENNLGVVRVRQGDTVGALNSYRAALERASQVYGDANPQVATYHANVAVALSMLGKRDAALVHGEAAVRIRRENFGEQHPLYAHALANLGANMSAMGRHGEAIERLTRSIRILIEARPAGHGEIEQVCQLARQALERAREAGSADAERLPSAESLGCPEAAPAVESNP